VSKLREILNQLPILTILALVFLAGLITYAVVEGSGSGSGASGGPTPALHSIQTLPPAAVEFSALRDGDAVNNPVSVAMDVGGVRYQKAGGPVQAGYGHLGLIIDGPTPAAGDRFVADATHIDLSDGSHVTTLPTLAPGPHTLTAIWANADDVITAPLLTKTIHITVAG
jgi:Domain of unknown function (DUF4399)